MSYYLNGQVGGESQDSIMEHPSGAIASSTVTVDTTAAYINTGSQCLKFPLSSSASKAIVYAVQASIGVTDATCKIVVLSGWIGASGTFSSAAGLYQSSTTQGAARYVQIGTDMKLRLYDKNGVQMGPATLGTVPTGAKTQFEISYDFGILPTRNDSVAWVCVKLGNKWEWEGLCTAPSGGLLFEIGSWGEYLPAATNRGADLFADDLVLRMSNTTVGGVRASDHPAHAAYPTLKVGGGAALPPTGNGTHVAWILTNAGGTGDYQSVDEFPNDGATTYVGSGTNGQKETYTYSAANPFTSADTIHHVCQRDVSALVAGGKSDFNVLYRDASANELTTTRFGLGSTSYTGIVTRIATDPAGNPWDYTDFDRTAGVSNLQFGGVTPAAPLTISFTCTSMPGPEVCYSNANNIFSRGQGG